MYQGQAGKRRSRFLRDTLMVRKCVALGRLLCLPTVQVMALLRDWHEPAATGLT
jgi:hypothetical protein